ncbi:MAG: 4Fe-4S cluster-binding domain-containing protein [Desulfovibrionaceae bacterium]|nr:4Fe-4S cluster-binding domain-containing protein [Desulfovibrionaceae bacterium]
MATRMPAGAVLPLRIAGIEPESIVDGPGIRYVLFLQGCLHGCPECQNPGTHDPAGGREVSVQELLEGVRARAFMRAVTFSGGEPFLQARALLPLAAALRAEGYHLCAYTGYTWEALQGMPDAAALLPLLDLLVDGPYLKEQRSLELRFRGSANQRILDVQASLRAGRVVLSPLHDG